MTGVRSIINGGVTVIKCKAGNYMVKTKDFYPKCDRIVMYPLSQKSGGDIS